MKILLSSIGTRGDVQPVLALALALRAHGHEPRLCVAPNFKDWIESHGLTCVPIGPDLKQLTGGVAPKASPPPAPPSLEQRRVLAGHTVRSQFPVLLEAARGCELVIGAGALQLATRSVTEALGVRYVFAAYCPVTLPSPDHPPPRFGVPHSLTLTAEENLALWAEEARSWDELFGAALNEERAKLGLLPVDHVQRHVFTERPWLAADPALGPAGASELQQIRQTGAWLLRDRTPLPEDVERFLADGAPPVYLGFGSMRATDDTGRVLVEAVRALGLRAILSQGWGELAPIDAAGDCLSIGDVAHEALFPRVAAVVHHGGAGTTTAAARAGAPQVIVPHSYDQPYWAHRVQTLGVGARGPGSDQLAVESVVTALRACLSPETEARAQALAARVRPDGARVAAELLGSM